MGASVGDLVGRMQQTCASSSQTLPESTISVLQHAFLLVPVVSLSLGTLSHISFAQADSKEPSSFSIQHHCEHRTPSTSSPPTSELAQRPFSGPSPRARSATIRARSSTGSDPSEGGFFSADRPPRRKLGRPFAFTQLARAKRQRWMNLMFY